MGRAGEQALEGTKEETREREWKRPREGRKSEDQKGEEGEEKGKHGREEAAGGRHGDSSAPGGERTRKVAEERRQEGGAVIARLVGQGTRGGTEGRNNL